MSFYKPNSLVFVRICPQELSNVFDSRLMTHTSNLAFSSQISDSGFYTNTNFANYTLSGTVFQSLFFARSDSETDPYFAIKESKAQQIIFTNTSMAANSIYTGSPAITGPVVTFRGDTVGKFKGVNLMDRVVNALESDLQAKTSDWDANSYANIVSTLQPIRALSHLLSNIYNNTVVCSSLTRSQIAIELAKTYDSCHLLSAADDESAQKAVYNFTDSSQIWSALLTKLDGSTEKKIGYLAISILFRNSTPRAKDYEFKIHVKISSSSNSLDETSFLSQHSSGFDPNQDFQLSGFYCPK